jgi:hypothetical protein
LAGANQQSQLNLHLAEDQAELRKKMELIVEAINAMDSSLRGVFDLLIDQGMLAENAAGVRSYEKSMAQLRKLGLRTSADKAKGGPQIQCPSCKTMLRIEGNSGERCEWCGHEF